MEPGFVCRQGSQALPSLCQGICGDGLEVHGEQCDDGNLLPGDGCDPFCQVGRMHMSTCAEGGNIMWREAIIAYLEQITQITIIIYHIAYIYNSL